MINFKLLLVLCVQLVTIECLKNCQVHQRQHQCEIRPQTAEGPYYLDRNLNRSDISEYRPGIPFKLSLYFTDSKTCEPIPELWAIIWQGDAIGLYSGYTRVDPTLFNGTLTGADRNRHVQASDNATFLRGAQQTDQDGKVEFITVLPGWYKPRSHHIHLKVVNKYQVDYWTGHLYFTDELSDWIHTVFPYYVQNRIRNNEDFVFNTYDGNQTTIYDIKYENPLRPTDGVIGQITIGLDITAK